MTSNGLPKALSFLAISGIPLFTPGVSVWAAVEIGMRRSKLQFVNGDILAIASKAVAKAEDQFVNLAKVTPTTRALEIAQIIGKDPRVVELVLHESIDVRRAAPGILITEHKLGFVMANAGIDQSNVGKKDHVLLLPKNPDESSEALRGEIYSATGCDVGILIVDSFGRPWRLGSCGTCIGASGVTTLDDRRGRQDLFGQTLHHTFVAVADELVATASLMMGQGAEGTPAIIIRGGECWRGEGRASDLLRKPSEDLFR
jgi:coenzyme F420-0:L-glutamate ligase/coenzyme F420-1:gamma-L-glutamate ligase